MQVLYKFDGDNLQDWRKSYSDLVRHEFYDGELNTKGMDRIELTMQQALESPISLLSITSNAYVSYRRSVAHIRANRVELYVLWMVRRGELKITRSSGTCTASEGSWAIINSQTPFFAEITPDNSGQHESVQAIVPAHLFHSYMPNLGNFETSFSANEGGGRVAKQLLDLLLGERGDLGERAVEPLVASMLCTTAESLNKIWDANEQRHSIVDRRRADIEAYIMRHLTSPDLSSSAVASGCHISPRYLCYLLKASNTSFSDLVWSKRLEKAREWLVKPSMRCQMIHEIAFMSGFKSAAHFSRMFKTAFGCTPSEFRTLHVATGADSGPVSSESVGIRTH